MSSVEERARAAAHEAEHLEMSGCTASVQESQYYHSPDCGVLYCLYLAGAAAEREAMLEVVRGHRCVEDTGQAYASGERKLRLLHAGQKCAEAIARELTEGRP